MKIGVLLIVLLPLLVGCASKSPRCDRRLMPINSLGGHGTRTTVVGP
jgi:hypothetical protein